MKLQLRKIIRKIRRENILEVCKILEFCKDFLKGIASFLFEFKINHNKKKAKFEGTLTGKHFQKLIEII